MKELELDLNKLKHAIDESGLKQKKVAEFADMNENYLSQILGGYRTPSRRVWKDIAQALGVDWTALAKSPNKAKAS